MSKRDWRLLAEDILECIGKIEGYIEGLTYEDFIKDEKTNVLPPFAKTILMPRSCKGHAASDASSPHGGQYSIITGNIVYLLESDEFFLRSHLFVFHLLGQLVAR